MMPSLVRRASMLLASVPLLLITVFADASAQQTGTVTGTVTAVESGRPVANTQVHFAAVRVGGLTNAQGRFLLQNVPAGEHVLTAERIGYAPSTQRVMVQAGGTVVVEFQLAERAISMEGIVVTGVAAETPQSELPFTVSRIDIDQISKVPAVNMGSMLQGKLTGVKVIQGSGLPGTEPSFQLRGPKSITGSQAPLVVIDGVITTGGMSDIDPADIESMEVVKGAAAAALYGSRAQAGVIQITTRTGFRLAEGQTQFIFRTTYQANQVERYIQKPMHHQWKMNEAKTEILGRNGQPITFPYQGSPALNDGGNGTNGFKTFMTNPYPPGWRISNPVEQFFRPGGAFTNYVAVAGNEGNTNYRISFDRMSQQGVIAHAKGLTQYNARLNVGQRIGDLQISANTYFSKRDRSLMAEGGGGPFQTLTFTTAAADLTARDPVTGKFLPVGEPIIQANVGRNPLYDLTHITDDETRARGMGALDANWAPTSWLTVESNGSFDRIETNRHRYEPPGLVRMFNTPGLGSILDRSDVRLEMNASITAALNFSLGDGFVSRSRIRYLMERMDQKWFSVQGSNLPVKDVQRLNLIGGVPNLQSYQQEIRSQGFFAISSMTYRNKYIADLLARRDGSSLFGPEERWQNYYRFSAAWRMTEEPWFNFGWLTELKPRYSIGTSGGRPAFEAQYQTYRVSAGSIVPQTLGNNKLKPELATEQEFGLDAVIAERFRVQANYVRTTIVDQLLQAPLPSTQGFESQWVNAATVKSNTRELSLEAALLERSNMVWTAQLNLDRTKNHISYLGIPPYRVQDYRAGLYIREGETIGAYYGLRFPTSCADLPNGTDCSHFEVNDDGLLVYVGAGNRYTEGKSKNLWGTTGEVNGYRFTWGHPISHLSSSWTPADVYLGDSEPSLNASFLQNFEWKNLGVTLLFDSEWGAQVYNQTMQWSCRDGFCALVDQVGKPEELQKPVSYYGANGVYANNKNNSFFTEDADYIKLRELSIRYTMPANQLPAMLQRAGFSQATINLSGRNLKTWTDYRGFDPEVGKNTFGGSAAVGRIDEYFYPNFRSLGIDVEIVF